MMRHSITCGHQSDRPPTSKLAIWPMPFLGKDEASKGDSNHGSTKTKGLWPPVYHIKGGLRPIQIA